MYRGTKRYEKISDAILWAIIFLGALFLIALLVYAISSNFSSLYEVLYRYFFSWFFSALHIVVYFGVIVVLGISFFFVPIVVGTGKSQFVHVEMKYMGVVGKSIELTAKDPTNTYKDIVIHQDIINTGKLDKKIIESKLEQKYDLHVGDTVSVRIDIQDKRVFFLTDKRFNFDKNEEHKIDLNT